VSYIGKISGRKAQNKEIIGQKMSFVKNERHYCVLVNIGSASSSSWSNPVFKSLDFGKLLIF